MKRSRIHTLKPYWRDQRGEGNQMEQTSFCRKHTKCDIVSYKGGTRLTYKFPNIFRPSLSVGTLGPSQLWRPPQMYLDSPPSGRSSYIHNFTTGWPKLFDCTRQGRIRMSMSQNIYNREVILSSLSRAPVSTVHVLSVCVVDLSLLQGGKVEEVRGPMDLVVEFLGVGQLQVILHVGVVADT